MNGMVMYTFVQLHSVFPTASSNASQYILNGLFQSEVRRIGVVWKANLSCSNAHFDISSSIGVGASSQRNCVKGHVFATNIYMNLNNNLPS
jgi:hypothetical protein